MAVDDVFLWNFLTDSKAKHEWRLVLSYLVQKDASELDRLEAMRSSHKDTCTAGMLRHLEFNEQAHQVLCSEVKLAPLCLPKHQHLIDLELRVLLLTCGATWLSLSICTLLLLGREYVLLYMMKMLPTEPHSSTISKGVCVYVCLSVSLSLSR